MKKSYIAALCLLAIIAITAAGYLVWGKVRRQGPLSPLVAPPPSVPTNFAKEAIVEFKKDGEMPLGIYLIVKENDLLGPPFSKMLEFDALSVCASEATAIPCVAMDVSWENFFGGKHVVVEGTEKDDGTVLVRVLRLVGSRDPVFIPQAGNIFIAWSQALKLVEECRVKMIIQSHNLRVGLVLDDGTKLMAIEPMIDEALATADRAHVRCGNIIVGTE